MSEKLNNKNHRFFLVVLACYFLPAVALVLFTVSQMPTDSAKWVFGLSFLLASLGSVALIFSFLRFKEGTTAPSAEVSASKAVEPLSEEREDVQAMQSELESLRGQEEALVEELEEVKEAWYRQKAEYEELQSQFANFKEEHLRVIAEYQEHSEKRERLLKEYTETVNGLRATMDDKQKEIHNLESSIDDLTYDLNTLLKVTETESDMPMPPTQEEFLRAPSPVVEREREGSKQLQRCLNIAQKLTSSYFAEDARFQMGMDNSALNRRRLYDAFRSESSCIVFVYSLREGHLVFANDQTKEFLGWGPENFIHDFKDLMRGGQEVWQETLNRLGQTQEAELLLSFASKNEGEKTLQCRLAVIRTGVFKNHAVGILYPLSTTSTVPGHI